MPLTIADAFLALNKQFIIAVSGMPGCGKTVIAKELSSAFGLEVIDQAKFYKPTLEQVTLHDGSIVDNRYSDDATDWQRFLSAIKSKSVINAFGFPTDLTSNVKVDLHIHISRSKQVCLEKRREFISKHKDNFPEEYMSIENNSDVALMNKLVYPYYIEVVKRSKIDKYINATAMNDDEVWDEVWDTVISFLQQWLKTYEANHSVEEIQQQIERAELAKTLNAPIKDVEVKPSGEPAAEPDMKPDVKPDVKPDSPEPPAEVAPEFAPEEVEPPSEIQQETPEMVPAETPEEEEDVVTSTIEETDSEEILISDDDGEVGYLVPLSSPEPINHILYKS